MLDLDHFENDADAAEHARYSIQGGTG
jgi:hypothetical protein